MNSKEKSGIYMLAHGFPEETEMAKHVKRVIKVCHEQAITGVPSKMGTHLTLLPPFYGDEDSVKFASSVLKVMTALIGNMQITISGIDIFPPPDKSKTEALHFKIELPDQYHTHVEWLKTSNTFDWVHPPIQTTAVEPLYVPHVHIIEGEKLRENIQRCYDEIHFMIFGKSFKLPPPQFFKKDTMARKWQQVT